MASPDGENGSASERLSEICQAKNWEYNFCVIQKPSAKLHVFEVGVQAGAYGSVGVGSTEHEASENGAKDIVELITRKEMALNNEGWQNWETKSGAKGKKGREKRLKNTRGSGSASGDDALTEESKDDEVKDLSAVLDKEDESRSLPPLNIPNDQTALEFLTKTALVDNIEVVCSLLEKATLKRPNYTVAVRMGSLGNAAMATTEEEAKERAARQVLREHLDLTKPVKKEPEKKSLGVKMPPRPSQMGGAVRSGFSMAHDPQPLMSKSTVGSADGDIANYLVSWIEAMHKSPVQFLMEWADMQHTSAHFEQQWVDSYQGSVQFSCSIGCYTGWGYGSSKAAARHFSTLNVLVKLYKAGLLHGRRVAYHELNRNQAPMRYPSGYHNTNFNANYNLHSYEKPYKERKQKDYSIGGKLSFKLLQDVAKKHGLSVKTEIKSDDSRRKEKRVEVKVDMDTESATEYAATRDDAELAAATKILKKLKMEKGSDYVFVPRRKKTDDVKKNDDESSKEEKKPAENGHHEKKNDWPPRSKEDVVNGTGKEPRVYLPDLCQSRGLEHPSVEASVKDPNATQKTFLVKVECGNEYSGWGQGQNPEEAENHAALMVIYEMVSGKKWPPEKATGDADAVVVDEAGDSSSISESDDCDASVSELHSIYSQNEKASFDVTECNTFPCKVPPQMFNTAAASYNWDMTGTYDVTLASFAKQPSKIASSYQGRTEFEMGSRFCGRIGDESDEWKSGDIELLVDVAMHGNVEDLRKLVQNMDVNTCGCDGQTPLLRCICKNSVRGVENLLTVGALPGVSSRISMGDDDWFAPNQLFPLEAAFIGKNLDVVHLLLKYGADPTQCDEGLTGILLLAMKQDNNKLRDYVTELSRFQGYKIDWQHCLQWAINAQRLDIVEHLVKNGGADLNKEKEKGALLPAAIAARNGDVALFQRLVQLGASMALALVNAVKNHELHCIRCLIKLGVDVNADVKIPGMVVRSTLVHLVATMNSVEILLLLKRAGVRTLVCDTKGNTPLHLAATSREDMLEFAEELLTSHEAENLCNVINIYGETALWLAVEDSKVDLVELFLSKGAFMHHVRGGLSAFAMAIMKKNYDVAQSLLHHGADPNLSCSRLTITKLLRLDNKLQSFKLLLQLLCEGALRSELLLTTSSKGSSRLLQMMLPLTLQVQSRMAIRSGLRNVCNGKSIKHAVALLPLPMRLKRYVCCGEESSCNYFNIP